jgi:hypothetical protein
VSCVCLVSCDNRFGSSKMPEKLFTYLVLSWWHERWLKRRHQPVRLQRLGVGSLPGVDAKAEGKRVVIGGWKPVRDEKGAIAKARSSWCSASRDESSTARAFGKGPPFKTIGALKLSAIVVALRVSGIGSMHAADAAAGGVPIPPAPTLCEEIGCNRQSTVECAYCDRDLCIGGNCAVWFELNRRPSPLCRDCADDEDEEGDFPRADTPRISEIRLDSLVQWRRDDPRLHMLVTVADIGPAPLPIRVHFNTEWSRLLREVSQLTNIPRDRFVLTFNGRQPHEDESLGTSGCIGGRIIRVRFLLPGPQ